MIKSKSGGNSTMSKTSDFSPVPSGQSTSEEPSTQLALMGCFAVSQKGQELDGYVKAELPPKWVVPSGQG